MQFFFSILLCLYCLAIIPICQYHIISHQMMAKANTAIIRLLFEITDVEDLISSRASLELHNSISQLHVTSTSTSAAINYLCVIIISISYNMMHFFLEVLTSSIVSIIANEVGDHILFRVVHCNYTKYWILMTF